MNARSGADVVVVGGGFFGLKIALFARETLGAEKVIVLERELEVMNRASYVNQARIHNGYHYPRSILTAYRSRVSSAAWAREYAGAVYDEFTHYYAIASRLSKVTARQFEVFCERIGAPLDALDGSDPLFSSALVERAWEAQEVAFDARKLRSIVLQQIAKMGGIEIRTGRSVTRLGQASPGVAVELSSGDTISAPLVVSSTYSEVNALHRSSGLPSIPLQLELAEMALVRMPAKLRNVGITVMDGPFFSVMPFPALNLHTLSHVRYTPQVRWLDTPDRPDSRSLPTVIELSDGATTFRQMIADAQRYVPLLKDAEYAGSVREMKAVLSASDQTDSRPILVRADLGLPGYICVMGGKIDNVNDVLDELAELVAQPKRLKLETNATVEF